MILRILIFYPALYLAISFAVMTIYNLATRDSFSSYGSFLASLFLFGVLMVVHLWQVKGVLWDLFRGRL
jgi:FtsH-binding integral membrane protein